MTRADVLAFLRGKGSIDGRWFGEAAPGERGNYWWRRHLDVLEAPLPMVLNCPACGLQHIDAPSPGWDNPPHRSHLCGGCGCIWRPADVPTVGVAEIETRGKADTWPPALEGRSVENDAPTELPLDGQ